MDEKHKLVDGGLSTDDRGTLRFVNDFHFKNVKRFYQVENHKVGFIRAWQGHQKEAKYVYVVRGAILLATIKMDNVNDVNSICSRFVLSSTKPQILYIPPGYFNGFKTLLPDTVIIFYSTNTIEEAKKDDYRYPFNAFNEIFNWDTD